jgi:hypothetical protein
MSAFEYDRALDLPAFADGFFSFAFMNFSPRISQGIRPGKACASKRFPFVLERNSFKDGSNL